MPAKRLVWLSVVAWLALLPTLARGQERQRLTVEAGTPVTVYADRVENLDRDRLLLAEGNVQIEQGDVRIEADRVEVNTETGEAVATGRVVLFDGRDRLTGDRVEYNLRSGTGIVYKAEGAAEPHFFFAGDSMERFGDKAYRVAKGVFTTCEDETPAWSIRFGRATAYLDDWMHGTNASFWVGKVPLVPFIPFFATSLRKDRHSGLLTPTFGSSNEKGFYVRQPIYFVLGDSQDLTLAPAYYEKRGFGLGATYRYVRREGSRGELGGFYLHDTEESPDYDADRWVVSLRHEEIFTPRLALRADIARVSDNTFLRGVRRHPGRAGRAAPRVQRVALAALGEVELRRPALLLPGSDDRGADRAEPPPRPQPQRLPAAHPSRPAVSPLPAGQLVRQLRAGHRVRGATARPGATPVVPVVARRLLHRHPTGRRSARPSTTPRSSAPRSTAASSSRTRGRS